MQTTLDSFTAKPKPVRNKKGRAHKNPNGTSWCGPTALTVLTGKRYDIIEKDLLRAVNKNKSTGGFNSRTASFVRKPNEYIPLRGYSTATTRLNSISGSLKTKSVTFLTDV